jgi:hypothetical protein
MVMVICFDANTEAKRSLDALLATGQFQDTSEVISIALVNYEVLQRSVSRGGPTVMPDKPTAQNQQPLAAGSEVTPPRPSRSVSLAPQIPELFFLNSSYADSIKLASIPVMSEGMPTNLPPARWLFGQYNKYLPVKASCRALLNLLRQKPGGVGLAEAVAAISQAAWELGDYLFLLDQQTGRAREDSFAAAFPVSATNGARSRIRFANQFVGDLRQPKQAEGQPKETKFNGLPAAIKFMHCSDRKNPILELTTAGAEFALMQNPIFDGTQEPASRKFSDGEIEFLLAHIRSCVPEELSAFVSIIDAITNGANTPDQVDKFLCERFQLEVMTVAKTENEITKTFLTTQRTGAISRLADLGLVTRAKEGLRVTYHLAPSASNFRSQIL